VNGLVSFEVLSVLNRIASVKAGIIMAQTLDAMWFDSTTLLQTSEYYMNRFGMKHPTGKLVIGKDFKFVGVTAGAIASQWTTEKEMMKTVNGLLKDPQFKKSDYFHLLNDAVVELV